jgi:N-sulfoglucosamine sulfohydrolase
MIRKTTLIALGLAATIAQAEAKERPNIIWLMAEDISNDLECYGTKGVKTPVLNSLAAEGLMFTNCISSNPICSPNRSSMMTGVHQSKINAHNHRSNVNIPLNEPYKPFTFWLREAGYTCVLGSEFVMRNGRKTDCNFKHTPTGAYDGITKFGLFDKQDVVTPLDQPFFQQIQLVATHRGDWWDQVREESKHPVNVNKIELPPFIADHPVTRLDWAKYLDQMEYIDNEISVIIQDLKKKGIYDNTIIIFIGDNGRCNIRGKGFLHDSGLRVPLIVHWPAKLKPQLRNDLVSTTDITATILDFAGIPIPDYMTGKSFIQPDFHHEYIYSTRDRWDEIPEKSRSLTGLQYKYIRNDEYSVPHDRYMGYTEFYRPALHIMRKLNMEGKLSEAEKVFFIDVKPMEELYDLQKDPFELNNLANDAKFNDVLVAMRNETRKQEALNQSSDKRNEPQPSEAYKVLEWIKYTNPALFQEMLNGKEIGFQRLSGEYRNYIRNRQSNDN